MECHDGSLLASRYSPEVPNVGAVGLVGPPSGRAVAYGFSRAPYWGAPRGFLVPAVLAHVFGFLGSGWLLAGRFR